jgi:serine/threonine protein phosphatase PrpC/predicted nucleic acid-binding Zn ribbon protein
VTAGPVPVAACPACGWPAEPDHNFCEACRQDLTQARQTVVRVVSGSAHGRASTCPFCPSAAVSADGYCEVCGRKLPSDRDHCELDLGLVAGVTDRGLRHSRNEDAMAFATVRMGLSTVLVAAVCDGVSGSPRPDEASRAAAAALIQVTLEQLRAGTDAGDAGASAVEAAREELAVLTPPGTDSPAATYVTAVMTSRDVTLCWLGDSRAYWLGARPELGAQRLTTDDSAASSMVESGLVSEEEALLLPQAHVVTQWLGADLPDARPHVARFEPPGPGVLLLCTDGLWNYQPDAAGLAGLALPAALTDPLDAAVSLTKFALDAGGMDNITVVLMPFPIEPPEETEPPDHEPGDWPSAGSA